MAIFQTLWRQSYEEDGCCEWRRACVAMRHLLGEGANDSEIIGIAKDDGYPCIDGAIDGIMSE